MYLMTYPRKFRTIRRLSESQDSEFDGVEHSAGDIGDRRRHDRIALGFTPCSRVDASRSRLIFLLIAAPAQCIIGRRPLQRHRLIPRRTSASIASPELHGIQPCPAVRGVTLCSGADVRFSAHCGLKSDIARGPKCAKNGSASLFDHFVGAGEQCGWYFDPERSRGLEIDHQLETRALDIRHLSGIASVQDSSALDAPKQKDRPIGRQYFR
jgi:hypothetical protein